MSKQEIIRVKPLIKEVTIEAGHLNNIMSTMNYEKTLKYIKLTIEAAESISGKFDKMSDDFEQLMKDK